MHIHSVAFEGMRLLAIREGDGGLDAPGGVFGGMGVAAGIVVGKAGFKILGEAGVEVERFLNCFQDVDVEEGLHIRL
jgi:hypothetical protein